MAILGSDIGLAAMLTVGAASFTAAIPAGVLIAGVAVGDIQVASVPISTPLWVRGPDVSLRSHVKNSTVGEWRYNTFMEMGSKEDAARFCRFYPLVRDAAVSLRAAVQPHISNIDNKPNAAPAEEHLTKTLEAALGPSAPISVLVHLAPTAETKTDERAAPLPAVHSHCKDGFLQNETKKNPRFVTPDRSIIF